MPLTKYWAWHDLKIPVEHRWKIAVVDGRPLCSDAFQPSCPGAVAESQPTVLGLAVGHRVLSSSCLVLRGSPQARQQSAEGLAAFCPLCYEQLSQEKGPAWKPAAC